MQVDSRAEGHLPGKWQLAQLLPLATRSDFPFCSQIRDGAGRACGWQPEEAAYTGGFSGSATWDTRFVAGGCSEDWTPAQACVIGVAPVRVEKES